MGIGSSRTTWTTIRDAIVRRSRVAPKPESPRRSRAGEEAFGLVLEEELVNDAVDALFLVVIEAETPRARFGESGS
jgi:hypothetical protein